MTNYIAAEGQFSVLWKSTLENTNRRFTIHKEYVLASILDPSQCRSNVLAQYCETLNVTPLQIINEFIEQFKIINPEETPNINDIQQTLTVGISRQTMPAAITKMD